MLFLSLFLSVSLSSTHSLLSLTDLWEWVQGNDLQNCELLMLAAQEEVKKHKKKKKRCRTTPKEEEGRVDKAQRNSV
jgi:hypothetical protein